MPIAVGLGARRNSCGCPPCEESGSDSGSDSGVPVDCCAVPIPRRLYASLFCGGSLSFTCAWDGTTVPLDYVYVPAEIPFLTPHHWEGDISFGAGADPCGTATGPGPFSLHVVLRLDEGSSTSTDCYWRIDVIDTTSGTTGSTPTNRWCRPEGTSPVARIGDSCNPVSVNEHIQFLDSFSGGIGQPCTGCPTSSGGGIWGNNGFVVVTA
jgi:hypothetical protein